MATAPKVLVAVATYNEIDNLPQLVEAILEAVPAAQILVIDDNSPDGTGDWVKKRAAGDDRISGLHRPGKLGLGTATFAGFRYALSEGYDVLVTLDADFSHPPDRIPALLEGLERADVTIGSRYVPGGGIEGWPFYRRLMSKGVNLYSRLLLGLAARDCSGAFRAFRVESLRKLNLDKMLSQGYAFPEETLWHLKRTGATMAEAPIVFTNRTRGESKINPTEVVSALWVIFRLGLRNHLGS